MKVEEETADERLIWVRAAAGRKIVQIIEAAPCGFSVTTQWLEGENLFRQDVNVAVRNGISSEGQAKGAE